MKETPGKPLSAKSKAKPAGARRGYDNSARTEKAKANQQHIIETLVEFLVERKGGEVTFEEIAQRSGISERTIYRFFRNKEELHRETNEYLTSYLRDGMQKIEALNVAGFGKEAFSLFDKYENLTLAYLYSRFGQEARVLFRARLNEAVIANILEEKPVDRNDPIVAKKLALITTLISAKIWSDIKTDFGYTGEQIGDTVEWALKALINAL